MRRAALSPRLRAVGGVDAELDPLAAQGRPGRLRPGLRRPGRASSTTSSPTTPSRSSHWFPAHDVANDLLSTYAAVGLASPIGFPPVTSGPLADLRRRPRVDRRRPGAPAQAAGRAARRRGRARSSRAGGVATSPAPRSRSLGQGGSLRPGPAVLRPLPGRHPAAHRGGSGRSQRSPRPSSGRSTSTPTSAALGDYPSLQRLARPRRRRRGQGAVDPAGKAQGRVRVEFDGAPDALVRRAGQHAVDALRVRRATVDPALRADPAGLLARGQLQLPRRALLGAPDRHRRLGAQGAQRRRVAAHPEAAPSRRSPSPSMTADEGSLPALRGAGLHGRAHRPRRVDRRPSSTTALVNTARRRAGARRAVRRGRHPRLPPRRRQGRPGLPQPVRAGRRVRRGDRLTGPTAARRRSPTTRGTSRARPTTSVPGDKDALPPRRDVLVVGLEPGGQAAGAPAEARGGRSTPTTSR